MERRSLLAAGAAAITGLFGAKSAQAAPSGALTLDEATRIVVGNVRNPPAPEEIQRLIAGINMQVMNRLTQAGIVDPQYVMTSAVVRFRGQVVEAKTRRLSSRYTFGENVPPIVQAEVEATLVESIVQEITAELVRPENKGIQYCPYELVTSSGVILDPETLNPTIFFLTRFGTFVKAA
jgi:hypothetical protein